MNIQNFLSTVRAANPDTTKTMSDDDVFHDFVSKFPETEELKDLSGLSLGQMSALVRRSNPDTANLTDYQIIKDFLQKFPQENSRLSTNARKDLGILGGGITEAFKAGFAQRPVEGMSRAQKLAHMVGEYALPTAGAIAGGISPVSSAAGAMAGEAAQKGLAQVLTPEYAEKESLGKIAADVGIQGATQYVGGKAFPAMAKLAGKALSGVGDFVGKKIIEPIISTLSGVSRETFAKIHEAPSKVLSLVGKDPESISDAAKAFVAAIESNKILAGERYRQIIGGVVRGSEKYGKDFTLNLAEDLTPVAKNIETEFGYNLPGRVYDKSEANIFNSFAEKIPGLSKATTDEAYFFQRDLTHAIDVNRGKPIAAALAQLKQATMGKLSAEIPEIAEANKIYASAMGLSDELSKVLNADDAKAIILSNIRRKTSTGDAIMQAADEIAGAREMLDNIVYGNAAHEITPWFAPLPRTGFAAGAGYGISQAIDNPILLAGIPFISPRISGLTVLGATKAGETIGKAAETEAAKTAGRFVGKGIASVAGGEIKKKK